MFIKVMLKLHTLHHFTSPCIHLMRTHALLKLSYSLRPTAIPHMFLSSQIVAFIMIGVAAGANVSSIVTSLSLVSGIIACAVFLLFISIVGLIGASKHHQVSDTAGGACYPAYTCSHMPWLVAWMYKGHELFLLVSEGLMWLRNYFYCSFCHSQRSCPVVGFWSSLVFQKCLKFSEMVEGLICLSSLGKVLS